MSTRDSERDEAIEEAFQALNDALQAELDDHWMLAKQLRNDATVATKKVEHPSDE